MAAKVYECMFLLDVNKVGSDLDGIVKHLHGLLEKHQAEILASRPWDERRLAYPVEGQKKGLYYLTYFRAEGKQIVEFERDCALYEPILRYLVIKLEHPRIVEGMLAVGRDENGAMALQTVTDPGPDDGLGDDHRERGGRRERYSRD